MDLYVFGDEIIFKRKKGGQKTAFLMFDFDLIKLVLACQSEHTLP